ncbi:MAG: hypothetical protein AB8B69_16200 [Chitinophagales bacterium]
MLTFVVNLHPGIPNMALAEPLLYPLRKEGKMHLIFPSTDKMEHRIEDANGQVQKYLERSPFIKWQVIFLVQIAADLNNPFRESLSGQMLLIRKLFLESELLGSKPSNSYMIAIDQINEDEAIPAINKNKNYRDAWELDTKGFIRNDRNFFIREEEIKGLDALWTSKINMDSSTIVNLGFERLPIEVKEKVGTAIEDITKRIDELLNPSTIDYRNYQITRGIRYIDEDLINGIKAEFFKRLQNTKNDPSRYNAFSPSATLRTAIAENLGIFSQDNEYTFKLIRFPFQYTHEDILQRYLIKLSILLTLIAENESVVRSLQQKNYVVKIDLDDPVVQQVVYNYMEHLHNTEQQLDNRLKNTPPVSLALYKDLDCACSETLDKPPAENLDFGFLRRNGDLPRWNNWNEMYEGQLENYVEQARGKMQICIDQTSFVNETPGKAEDVNIDEQVNALNKEQNKLQSKVEHNFLSQTYSFTWKDYQKEQEKVLKPKLFSRPNTNEIAMLLAVATLVFAIPFVFFKTADEVSIWNMDIGTELVYFLAVLILMGIVTFVAHTLAKNKYLKELDKIVKDVLAKAQSLRMSINDEFERQKDYLKSLCRLSTVRKNYEIARTAQIHKNNNNVMLDYHRRKLEDHKNSARKIMRIFKANEQSLNNNYNDKLAPLDVEKPPYANDVYAINTFINPPSIDDREVGKVENIKHVIKNDIEHLMTLISFDKDRIYEKGEV